MAPTKNNNTVLRKSGKSGKQPASTLTREQIEDDLAAFRKAGGKIEKLGVTRVLQTVEPAKSGEVAKSVPPARPRSR